MSFHDRDAGYSVTQGDYFVIDSKLLDQMMEHGV